MRVRVRVHVRSASVRTEWRGDVLHVWVTAPPVEGSANQAVLDAVAGQFRTRRSAVRLVAGERARDKLLEVSGVAAGADGARSAPPAPRR